MKRKFLDDIGVKDRPDKWNKGDKRQKRWKKERKKYGFDERELWSLDYTFYLWLYERLMAYKETSAGSYFANKFEYCGKEYTQNELIDIMLDRLEIYFAEKLCGEKYADNIKSVGEIWAIVLPAMWYWY